jgi:hypothetical protein
LLLFLYFPFCILQRWLHELVSTLLTSLPLHGKAVWLNPLCFGFAVILFFRVFTNVLQYVACRHFVCCLFERSSSGSRGDLQNRIRNTFNRTVTYHWKGLNIL